MAEHPCCLHSLEPHTGPNMEMHMMLVINQPGLSPRVITTPRFAKDAGDALCVPALLKAAVLDGAQDIAKEVRKIYKIKEEDVDKEVADTIWGKMPVGDDAGQNQRGAA